MGGTMKKLYIAVLTGAVLAVAGSATAADLGPGPVYGAPAVGPAPAFSWTGPYAGLFGGYGWGTAKATEPINAAKVEYAYFDFGTLDTTGTSTFAQRETQSIDVTAHSVRVGLNYRWGAR